ncbi:hypothetical protein C1645_444633 [Glomus cerebriforme]|uniref:Uncharacterized protein n=1 Tax=Glomus cerebriforme TaxID=658196 RepID=A0A397SM08_9GLOM|nr:hypothetical protein C1645_444633 [Glomus cerebriforme]
MGNELSLVDIPDSIDTQGYLSSVLEESTRKSYEQLRYERSKLGKVKREKFELQQEKYERDLRDEEALKKLKLQNKRKNHEVLGINNNILYQNTGLERRQNVEYGDIYPRDLDFAMLKGISKTMMSKRLIMNEMNKIIKILNFSNF